MLGRQPAGLGVGMLLSMMEQYQASLPHHVQACYGDFMWQMRPHYTHCTSAERRFYACGHELSCQLASEKRIVSKLFFFLLLLYRDKPYDPTEGYSALL